MAASAELLENFSPLMLGDQASGGDGASSKTR